MRETKFRAWDGDAGTFIYSDKESDDYDFCFSGGKLKAFVFVYRMATIDDPDGMESAELDNVDEFTGLHDKNGKEIYEGDIVQSQQDFGVEAFSETRDVIEVVEYRGGAFYPACTMPAGNFEVIGNIYENPELFR